MFSKLREFISHHKRKFIVGGLFVGGTVVLSRYVKQMLIEFHERETRELLDRSRKQLHYESIERTCSQTALTIAQNVKDTINKLLKTEDLIEKLKLKAPDKIAIWERLKILSFTKISALIYATSFLMITLRIQLNIIGGYMYCDSTNENGEMHINNNIQERYLNLCQYFVKKNISKLCNLIEEKVKLIIGSKSLKEKLTVHDIEQIFWSIQSSISSDPEDPCKTLTKYILPETFRSDTIPDVPPILDKIIKETEDLLESDEIVSLTKSCISRGFSFVMDEVSEYFRVRNDNIPQKINKKDGIAVSSTSLTSDGTRVERGADPAKKAENFVDLKATSIPMAKVIPIINGLVPYHSSKTDVPHMWMLQLLLMDSLKVLGANVYETFSSSNG